MDTLCEERLTICRNCVLYKKNYIGEIRCDSGKYANEDGTKSSYLPKDGWKRGCGCRLDLVCSNPNKQCVLGKW